MPTNNTASKTKTPAKKAPAKKATAEPPAEVAPRSRVDIADEVWQADIKAATDARDWDGLVVLFADYNRFLSRHPELLAAG